MTTEEKLEKLEKAYTELAKQNDALYREVNRLVKSLKMHNKYEHGITL